MMHVPTKRNAAWMCGLVAMAVAISVAPEARADEWPTRPVTMIVPFPAGGNIDVAARLFAKELTEKLGQRIVVENKPGAGGGIGSAQVAKAAADGYTLLLTGTGPVVFNKLLYKSIPYDPDADFTPIIITNDVPQVLVVDPKLPIQTLADLQAYAKRKPGGISIGHAGPGTTGHLATLLLLAQTKIEAVQVSYRGAAPLVSDLLGGQIEAGFPSYVPQIASVRALGVTSEQRLALLPDVPTIRESGVADVVATTWNALVGPAGLPAPIVQKLNGILNAYLASPAGREQLTALGARPLGGTPQQAVETIARDKAKWEPIIREANIKLD